MKNKNTECRERLCFANINGACDVLTEVRCAVGCPFFKTEEKLEAERKKSDERNKKLKIGQKVQD